MIYNVLEDMVFLVSQVSGLKHMVEEVPTGVTLWYQVAALDSIGRVGLFSAIVEVAGIAILHRLSFLCYDTSCIGPICMYTDALVLPPTLCAPLQFLSCQHPRMYRLRRFLDSPTDSPGRL